MKALPTMMTLLLLAGIAVLAAPPAVADPSLSEITFYVHWYDVGKAALDGLDGVKKVTRGWRGGHEINTVTFDPGVITPEEMVAALKAADTYAGTAEWVSPIMTPSYHLWRREPDEMTAHWARRSPLQDIPPVVAWDRFHRTIQAGRTIP